VHPHDITFSNFLQAKTKQDTHLMPLQVGAIVPWNYPFHNVINPLTSCIFSGNALVIKVRCKKSVCAFLKRYRLTANHQSHTQQVCQKSRQAFVHAL